MSLNKYLLLIINLPIQDCKWKFIIRQGTNLCKIITNQKPCLYLLQNVQTAILDFSGNDYYYVLLYS